MEITQQRIFIYSLLEGIECDLRNLIKDYILIEKDIYDIFPEDVTSKIIDRFVKDHDANPKTSDLDALLDYLDFSEEYKAILSNKNLPRIQL